MWMIYGANGYTGELIARACAAQMKPVLAGRRREKIEPLARELGLQWRAFDLNDVDLGGVSLVLNCAGPFVHTSGPMLEACLAEGVHYLDITGEIAVFERVMALDGEAERRGVTLLPGVGFDVVPTDCLAAMLAAKLPGATELMLAFGGASHISGGTARTAAENLGEGGAIRKDGRIVRVPVAFDAREIPFRSGPRFAMTIPWGDVSTAYYSTGIPNIRVYLSTPPSQVRRLRRMAPLFSIARFGPVRSLLGWLASKRHGPDATARARGRMQLWGSVSNASGKTVTMTMTTPEAYALTVQTAIAAVRRVLEEPRRGGAFTPSLRFGADFIRQFEGVEVQSL